MIFFEKNMLALEEYYPHLAKKIREIGSVLEEELVEVSPQIFDVTDKQGKKLYEGFPLQKAEYFLSKANLLNPKFVVFYGLGLGYSLREFHSKFGQKFEAGILVEKCLALFRLSLEILDWTEIISSKKILLLVDESLESVKQKLGVFFAGGIFLMYTKTITPIYDESALLWAENNYYLDIAKCIKDQIAFVAQFTIGSFEDSYQAFMNVMSNVYYAQGVPSFTCLLEKFVNFPGIVVSTGPSLNHSLEWLKKNQHKAVISCADSALRILKKNGITPHIVSCLERSTMTRKYFDEFEDLKDTYLLSDLSIGADTYQKYSGPKINYFRPIAQQHWFFPRECYREAGTSVAHLNLLALHAMGCSPVFLVGQDLAYDPNTHAGHASGIISTLENYDKKELQYIKDTYVSAGNNEVWVEGNNGKKILTTPIWNHFREVLEYYILRKGIRCFNVIPENYGAFLKDAPRLDPEQVDSYLTEERNIFEEIAKSLNSSSVQNKNEFYNKLGFKFHLALQQLAYLKEVSLEILDSMSVFMHQYDLILDGFEIYKTFLLKLEQAMLRLECIPENPEEDFFGFFLYPQIQGKVMAIYQELEALLKLPEQSVPRVREQIKMVREWFEVVHYTCSRMENFIVKHLPEEQRQALDINHE